MTSGAMKVKVVDSEKTSKVFLTKLRQNVALDKALRDLELSEETVVNRISSTQKVTYRRFQTKLQKSELMSARMRGDTEKVVALRRDTNKSGVSLNDDDEVNEVLKRIWRNGSGRMKRQPLFGSDGRRVRSAVTIRTLDPAEPEVQEKEKRPKTAFARMQGNQSRLRQKSAPPTVPQIRVDSPDFAGVNSRQIRSQFITTGLAEPDEADDDVPILPERQRPSTQLGFHRISSHSASHASTSRSSISAADFLSNVDPFEKAQTDRLERHRHQLKAANYNSQIRLFCKSLHPYTNDKERFIEDYYYSRLLSKKPSLIYNNFVIPENKTIVPSDSEFWRSVGNPKVRPLTMKRLNLDYSDLLPTKNNDTPQSSDEETETEEEFS